MDLGLVAQSVRRVGAATDLRAGVERVNLPVRLLLPFLPQGAGAAGELARDIRAAAIGRDSVTLLLPAQQAQASVPARLEIGARQFVLPPALRDALLAALPAAASTSAANAAIAPTTSAVRAANAAAADQFARAWAVAAQTTAAAAQVVGGSGATRAVHRQRDDALPPAVRFVPPLFEPVAELQPAAAIAERLRTHVERSGLFFESHIAQWAGGERSAAELRAEALRVAPQAAGEHAQRVAAQVAVLNEGAFVVHGPAWRGQPMELAIEREPHPNSDPGGDDAPVFVARLALDLPQLGRLQVRLRLAGDAVSARLQADAPAPFAGALRELAEQLAARGLVPVQLQAEAPEGQE